MKFYDAVKEFLYDQKYFITLYEDGLHVFNYISLVKISSKIMQIKIASFTLNIFGDNLYVAKLSKEELSIKGTINKIEKIYE